MTDCAAQSPHDQYFFRRISDMVAGSVFPPALDLANEELVRAHLHTIWLAQTGQALSANILEMLGLEGEGLPLRPEIREKIFDLEVAERARPRWGAW